MNLQEWINTEANKPSEDMVWHDAFWNQIFFIRDTITYLIGNGLSSKEIDKLPIVISTHTSKSVLLPVVSLERKDLGIRFILRDNFHNWKLSVISEKPIDVDLDGLCHTDPPIDPDYTGDPLHPVYFEGFPRDLVFGYYSSNKNKFSAEIYSNYNLYTVIFLIMKSLGVITSYKWKSCPKDSIYYKGDKNE